MKLRNGFTLMEMLAIIMILAIIVLVATPVVSSIINNTKKSTFESSVKHIMESIDWYLLDKYDGKYTGSKTFELSTSGIFEVIGSNKVEDIEFDGKVRGSGQIIANESGKLFVRYSDGNYCATKDYLAKKLTIKSGECN